MDANLAKELFEITLPYIVHHLLKKGKFKGVNLKSPSKLLKVYDDNLENCMTELEVPMDISNRFIVWAQKAYNEDEKFVAIVLVATAMEQELNKCYRFILREEGLLYEEITEVIRKHNIEPKITWLLKLIGKIELDDNLRKNVLEIFSIRNSIIHYKSIFTKFDQDTGSHEKINLAIKRIEKIDIFHLYEEFYVKLYEICFLRNKDWTRAIQIAQKINSYLSKKKKKSI